MCHPWFVCQKQNHSQHQKSKQEKQTTEQMYIFLFYSKIKEIRDIAVVSQISHDKLFQSHYNKCLINSLYRTNTFFILENELSYHWCHIGGDILKRACINYIHNVKLLINLIGIFNLWMNLLRNYLFLSMYCVYMFPKSQSKALIVLGI